MPSCPLKSCISMSASFELIFSYWQKNLHMGCVFLGESLGFNELGLEITGDVSDRPA